MMYFMQLLRMMKADNQKLLIGLLDDLSFEIEELGYEGIESDLVADILMSHFDLEFESDSQLEILTDYILKHQGQLEKQAKTFKLLGVA